MIWYTYISIPYSSRTDIPICTKLGTLISWDQEVITGGSKLRNVSWVRFPLRVFPVARKISTIGMTPRPKLIVSKRRLQKQRPELRKIVRGSIPSEDGFYSSDNKHDRKNGAKTRVVCFEEEILPGIPRRTHSPDSFAVGLCVKNARVFCRGKLLPPRAWYATHCKHVCVFLKVNTLFKGLAITANAQNVSLLLLNTLQVSWKYCLTLVSVHWPR
jgi:hypothetical protein